MFFHIWERDYAVIYTMICKAYISQLICAIGAIEEAILDGHAKNITRIIYEW